MDFKEMAKKLDKKSIRKDFAQKALKSSLQDDGSYVFNLDLINFKGAGTLVVSPQLKSFRFFTGQMDVVPAKTVANIIKIHLSSEFGIETGIHFRDEKTGQVYAGDNAQSTLIPGSALLAVTDPVSAQKKPIKLFKIK